MNRHASIHCASHGNCVIAGNSGGPTRERLINSFGKNLFGEEQIDTKPFLITQTDGVWGSPQFPMVKKLQNLGSTFYTLKCKTNLDCVIQGGYVPALTLMNKLKAQNNMQREIANKAVLSLGFTLTLSNGSWGEPKTNLGGAFKKGPFPKGDPKVQFNWTTNDNDFNDLTNMMPCIKSEDCLVGPISTVGQIQPAGVGNPTWPVKCPRVVDSVKTPQPKVLGFKFDGNGETYTRLTDGDSVASKSPGDLVGCYAVLSWFIPTSKGANYYHIGTFNRDASGYYWQNPVGDQWRLTLSGSILTTDKNNPYYDEGRQFITY